MGKLAASSYRLQYHGSHPQTPIWKRSPITLFFVVLFGSCTFVTFLFVEYDGRDWNATSTKDRQSTMIFDDERKSAVSRIGGQFRGRQQPTMPPRESSFDTAGFVHIGKTGGSTISNLLRNGCNSFQSGPCRFVENETRVSKLVEHYYHVPDFWRLPTSNHKMFIVSARDVYDRSVSALLYHHPNNSKYYNLRLTEREQHFGPLAYECFPTLESFAALMIRGNVSECNYPYRHNVIEPKDCVELACAVIHGKVRFFSHLFFNYRNIVDTKLPFHDDGGPTNATTIYVLRQERLWEDWTAVNLLLGQTEPVVIPREDTFNQRNISGLQLPVTRHISDEGRKKLCKALESEYMAYFRLLSRASNLASSDLEFCTKIAERNCPNLDIVSMMKMTIEQTNKTNSLQRKPR